MNLAKLKLLAPSIADVGDSNLQAYIDAAWDTFRDIWVIEDALASVPDNVALAMSYFIVMSLRDTETAGQAASQVSIQGGLIIREKIGDYEYQKSPPVLTTTNTKAWGSKPGDPAVLGDLILQLMWKYPYRMPEREVPVVY